MTDVVRRDRGAVLPIVAMLLPVLILMTTVFAVDLGRLRSSRREMQARADAVALDLVRLTGGATTWPGIGQGPVYTAALANTAARNNIEVSKLQVVWGTWDKVNGFSPCLDTTTCHNASPTVPTAVLVTAQEDTKYFFQPGHGHTTRTALAANTPLAAFTIGSFAARINTDGNTVLALMASLTGLSTTTTLAGYNGLASSRLSIGELLTQLAIGDPDQVASTNVSLGDFYVAAANALNRPGASSTDVANAAVLNGIGNAIIASPSKDNVVPLGSLLSIAPGGGDAALDASMNALDLMTAAAQLANGTSGAEVSGLGLTLPGIGGASGSLDLIQPPVLIAGPVGTSGRTDQAKAVVNGTILNGSGLSALAGLSTRVTVETASGLGTINAVSCNSSPETFTAGVATSLLTTKAEVFVTLLGIPVTITVSKDPPDPTGQVVFTRTDDLSDQRLQTFTPDPKVVGQTSTLGLNGTSAVVTTTSVVPPLVQAAFNALLSPILSAVTATLIPTVIDPLLAPIVAQLGVNVGGADVRPLSVACDGNRLVG